MDPATPLDHALFQLTPTRTRCDLVVFSSDGEEEKLASGLLEPFLSHLKAAEEQISKGGYSIKLQLTPGEDANASWFTKGTVERFVRFVKTPEILERVVTIEREISQIEDSIRCNELSVSKSESDADDSGHGENSKIQLLRVLETRKSVLRKEQGMSYAQASAAGFEIDYIDDLISFSDAFGASRLRDACKNFKELCKRKHDAGLWLDELATATTSSQSDLSCMGVPAILLQNGMPTVLVADASQKKSESDGSAASIISTTNGNHETSNFGQDNMPQRPTQDQPPVTGSNPQPAFLYNVQSSGVPSPFPFPGYIMPGVQMMPPFYPGYSGTTQHQYENPVSGLFPEQDYGKHHSPYSMKRKTVNKKSHRSSQSNLGSADEYSDQDYSSSGDEADASLHHETVSKSSSAGKVGNRKTGKKSSRVVVIRNINYVTSRKREESKDGTENNCSSEDDFIDGDYLEQNVEDAVESLKRHHKVVHHNHKKEGDKNSSHDAKSSGDSVNIMENATIRKSNGENHDRTWDAFQNLLLRDDHDESSSIKIVDHDPSGYPSIPNKQASDAGDEHLMVKKVDAVETPGSATFQSETKGGAKRLVTDDSFIMAERDVNNIATAPNGSLESEAHYKAVKLKKSGYEEVMLAGQTQSNNGQVTISDYSQEQPMVNYHSQTEQFMTMPERFIGNKEDSSSYASALVENQLQAGKSEEKKLIDDSYVVVSTKTIQPDVQWKTDIYVDEAISFETHPSEHDLGSAGISNKYEPDDLFMIVHRENEVELQRESWTPEIDYNVRTPGSGADMTPSSPKANGPVVANVPPSPNGEKCKKETETRGANKDTRSTATRGHPRNSRPEIGIRKTKPLNRDAIQKAKKDKEEEERKRIEQLLIQRQQRISQRSGTSSNKVTRSNQSNTSKSPKTTLGEERNNKVLANSASTTSSGKAVRKGYGVPVKV
ncbi:hypothetical protein EJ110_NYTH21403 [Nymphaea thermarum]|nr:hypothetical protein EJ110_NYTH21403 [Nymphaea thermarum]